MERAKLWAVLVGVALAVSAGSAHAVAATRTWDGGVGGTGTSLSTGANWVGDTAPVAGDSMIFPLGFTVTLTNDYTAGTSFAQLTFAGGSYRITGNAMTLTSGIVVTGMSSPHEIAAPLTVGDNWALTIGNTFRLILSGSLDNVATKTITLNGGATTGTLEVAVNNSATLSSAISIGGGTLQATADQALGTGTVTVSAAATLSISGSKTIVSTFDGNDTLVLNKPNAPNAGVKDVFGISGSAPKAGFFGFGRISKDRTLRRADVPLVTGGFPSATPIPADWVVSDTDTIAGLGSATAWSLANKPADLAFSEYVEGSGNNQAIEIFNDTSGGGSKDLGMPGTRDITLRRKASVVQGDFDGFTPPGDQIASEWDHFDTNTFSGLGSHSGPAGVADLFFSEYVEDSTGNNQALEIYNGTGASVNLTGYSIEIYANGSSTPTSTVILSGTLNNNGVFVVANAAATDATVLAEKDLLSAALANVTGNDAIVLRKGPNASDVLDTFGIVGDNPGAGYWGTLPRYTLEIYPDGANSNPFVIDLSSGGTLANASVLVVANPAAAAGILSQADILDSNLGEMNGNDTVVLKRMGTAIDTFGIVGTNPAAGYFGTIAVASQGMHLRRVDQATLDVNGFNSAADISADWLKVTPPTTTSLGVAESFTVTTPAAADRVFFTEYVELGGDNRAIELINKTGGALTLSQYEVQIFKDGGGTAASVLNLGAAGTTLADGATLVIANFNATDSGITGAGGLKINDSQIISRTLDNNFVFTGNLTLLVEEKDTLHLNGAQSGAGALNHPNLGTLILAGDNSARTGGTDLSGPVKIDANGAFGDGTATITVSGNTVTLEPLSSPANLTVANPINLASSARQLLPLVAAGDVLALSGNITGAGSLRKLGPGGEGQLTLTGAASTFSGGFEIDDGIVAFSNAAALGNAALANITIGGAATLRPTASGLAVNHDIAFLPGSGAPKLTLDLGSANNLTLGGAISGSGSLGVAGAVNLGETAFPGATLTLGVSNSFTKGVSLEGGNLAVGHNNALGTGPLQASENARLSASGGSRTLANKVSLTKILELIGNANNITLNGVLDGSGILSKAGTHTLTLGAANALSNEVRMGDGTVLIGNDLSFGTAKVLVGGNVTLSASSPNVTLENDIGRLEPPMFDGNDTITLKDDTNAVVDRIGILSNNPGSGFWGTEPITTRDHLLKRKTSVTAGDPSGFAAPGTTTSADISSEWDGFAPDASSDFGTAPTVNVSDLAFSEYIVGTAANNRAVEIFNGTAAGVDLSAGQYTLEIYTNGSNSSPLVIGLGTLGTLNAGSSVVIADPAAAAAILAVADLTDVKMTSVTGNDTLILKKGNGTTTVDVFGILGNDPGASGWGTAPVSTVAQTLRRRTDVALDTNGFNSGANISDQWTAAGLDAFLGLDAHQKQSPATTTLLFSEYLDGSFDDQQLELFNGTGSAVDLTNWKVEVAHDGSGTATATLDLSSFGQFASGSAISLPTILAATHPAFTLTINGSNNLTLEGSITGQDLNLVKDGTGTLALNESNSYVGTTTFNTGTISLGKQVGALGDGNLVIGSPGTRTLTASNPNPVQVKNSVQLNNPLTINLTSPNVLEIRKAMVGSSTLTKTGTGTLTLSSTFAVANSPSSSALIVTSKSTYSGGTVLNGGRLIVEDDDALGTGGLTVGGSGGTLEAGPAYVKDSAPLTDPISAPVAILLDDAMTLNAGLTVDGENGLTIDVSIAAGAGSLTKAGTGILTLPKSNGHTGGTTLADGGLLLGHNSALGSGTFTVSGGSVGSSSGARTLSNTLSLGGNFSVAGAGNVTFSSGGALTVDSSVEVGTGLLATMSGNLSGATFRLSQGSGSLGRLRLSGNNTFTNFTQAGGILEIDNNGALGGIAGNLTISGGSVRAVTSPWTVVKGSITLGGNITFDFFGTPQGLALNGPVTLTSNTTLNLQSSAGVTLGGAIGGGGNTLSLDLASTSRLTLNGACTYTGDTTIHGGILRMGPSASLASNVLVDPAGTFEGAGTVQDVTCSGILSPGGDGVIGQLTVDNLIFTAGSKLKVDVNGTTPANDKVVVVNPGAVNLGNQLCILEGTQTGSSDNDAYVIIDNQGSSAVSGIFDGIADGGSVTLSGRSFGVFYDHLNGDDVALLDDRPPTGPDQFYVTDMNPAEFYPAFNRLIVAAPGVLTGVTDADGDSFAAEVLVEPINNTAEPPVLGPPPVDYKFVLRPDGSFDYTPEIGFFGVDRFTYVIRDEHGVISAVRTAEITVNEVFPHVTGHPQDITVMATEIFSLTTDAVGSDPKSYQWFKGTSPNESNPVLFNASAQTPTLVEQITVVGQYPFWCKVSNTVNGDPYFAYSIEAVVTVIPGPLDHFDVAGLPTQVRQNDPEAISVSPRDIFENTITDYVGSITFTCDDTGATLDSGSGASTLPDSYTFLVSDNGTHSFTLTMTELGAKVLTLTDAGPDPDVVTDVDILVNNPPVFTLTAPHLTATPNPATVNQSVTFNTGATDDDPLDWHWDFGDLSTPLDQTAVPSGATSAIHTFTPADTYTITVTAIDADGITIQTSIDLVVQAAIVGPNGEIDSDGDGWSDVIEIGALTDPLDVDDTPDGSAPAPTPSGLTTVKLKIGLNFAKPLTDKVQLKATMPTPAGFTPAFARVLVDVGGVVNDFTTLNDKGSTPSGVLNSLKVKNSTSSGLTTVTMKLKNGSFQAQFADELLLNQDATKSPRTVGVTIFLGGALKQTAQPLLYTAKLDGKGNAK